MTVGLWLILAIAIPSMYVGVVIGMSIRDWMDIHKGE